MFFYCISFVEKKHIIILQNEIFTKTIIDMYDNNHGLYIAHCADGALAIQGKMANRHGLIAGATGTGKTVTLQVQTTTKKAVLACAL